MNDTGIQCQSCEAANLHDPEDGAQYECPACGAVVAPETAKRSESWRAGQ